MIAHFNDDRDWFFDKRFGLFIHWGIYALDGWHEQIQWRRNIPKAQYVERAQRFNPVGFDPDVWLDLAAEAGMEYLCFTTKHHDGFCMWDTRHSDYKITNTPYGQDVLAKLAEACHRRHIPLELYYSCPDWHHPNAINFGGDHQLPQPNPGDQPDLLQYVAYVRSQITELCSNYGKIAGFFWDIPPRITIPDLNALLRRLQPGIVINNRGFGPGDYSTPERHVPDGQAFTTPTEACQSIGAQSWGFRENEDYFTPLFLMRSMDKILCMGGNYLLNVGPQADGALPPAAHDILRRIGRWYHRVKEAFQDSQPATQLCANPDCMLTRRGNTLYVHFPKGLNSSGVVLNPLRVMPKEATLLNNGQPVRCAVEVVPSWYQSPPWLHLSDIPATALQDEVPIIKLVFDNLDNALAQPAAGAKEQPF
ncbi:MAG TPA: alpha-L-fucosidase [Lentisphaeria bacterium]|nr:alpha-L-fucosidase [Lentisphaeria bacterium]